MNLEDSPLLGGGSSRSSSDRSESAQQFHGQEHLAREQPREQGVPCSHLAWLYRIVGVRRQANNYR
jgi:hypothetical protein